MKAVECPECGAQNAESSEVCNRCGAPLAAIGGQGCPVCGTLNAAGVTRCENCGTPLEASPLPADEEPAAEEIYDWLAELDAEESDLLEGAAPDLAGDETGESITDWLASLDDEHDDEAEEAIWDEAFDPLDAEDGSDQPGPEAEGEFEAETVPDWLREIDTVPESQQEPHADDEGTLEWEADAIEEGAGVEIPSDVEEDGDQIPDWLTGVETEATGAGESLEQAGQDLFEPEAEVIEPITEAARDVPDWLDSMDEDEEEGDWYPDDLETDAPSWLTGQEEEVAPGEVVSSGEEMPDWLIEMEREGDALQPGPTDEIAVPDPGSEEVDEAGWLAGLGSADDVQPVQEEDTAAPQEPDESQDWLRELAEAGEEAAPSDDDGEAIPTAEFPEWLQEIAPPQTGPLVPTSKDETAAEDVDLTDFLAALESDEELPDWLSPADLAAEEEAVAADLDAESERPAELTDEEEETVPDWLEGMDLPDEEDLEPDVGPFVAATELQVPDTPGEEGSEQEEEFPEWLEDVLSDIDDVSVEEEPEMEPSVADATEAPEQLVGAELPEWLENSFPGGETPAEPTPDEEIPTWLQPPGEEQETPAEEELEQLGQALQLEPGGEWSTVLDEAPSQEDATEEVSATEVPEWLKELKPQQAAAEALPEAIAERVVTGPLAGLSGVIPVAPALATSPKAPRLSPTALDPGQPQSVQLLRQLTREEPDEVTQVTSVPAVATSAILRVLLALLLIIAVLVGLSVPELVSTTVAPPADAGALENLLAAASGQPVVVAFEYSPAMAGALDAQAQSLLEQFASQESPVLLTSLSPAGFALAQEMAGRVDGLESQAIGYVPGDAIGLRDLSTCIGSGGCESVGGRALAPEIGQPLASTALIALLAADRDSLVDWVEQVNAASGVPLVAVVPESLAPIAGPYRASGQLDVLLAGQNAVFGAGAAESDGLDALALGQWLVVLALILGNAFYFVSGELRSRRGQIT